MRYTLDGYNSLDTEEKLALVKVSGSLNNKKKEINFFPDK
jgi:hypothetical protein